MIALGLDIGSNSVGSCWLDGDSGQLVVGTSVFPAGVEESDDKRGDPKNVKRRMTRHARTTLARRAGRKRELRLKLIATDLLPASAEEFGKLLESTDPWSLRARGLHEQLTPHEFGRVLLHLAQRRGALGLKIDEAEEVDAKTENGKVKEAIKEVKKGMDERKAATFGAFIALLRAERVTAITTEDKRPEGARKGPREYRGAIRNKAGSYEHCVDRKMIRDEFAMLWDAQKRLGGPLAAKLSDDLRLELDNESSAGIWRHEGLLFGQRKTYWDTGTLGRCDLEPTERCVPHADMYASRYLVVETVNNLKIIERGKDARSLTPDERDKIKTYLSGPLGVHKKTQYKGQPKRSVSVTDLRDLMDNWGPARKSQFRFNIEADEERTINTDWFSREIIHGAISVEKWQGMAERVRDGINRAILKHDPNDDAHAAKLKSLVMKDWAGLSEAQADSLVAAWKRRPHPDEKKLNMSRRAARNVLQLMDRPEPWPDSNRQNQTRWLTQIEARKRIAEDAEFVDVTTGKPLDDRARGRYATGAKGATARDRHFMRKHLLSKNGETVCGPGGLPLHEPPPVPVIGNPVVRKSIHEVRRHLIEYMVTFARKPDEVYVELSREAKMGKKQADELLLRNRLRNRIRRDIIAMFGLDASTSTQQRAAVDRVVLSVQQRGICPMCGQAGLTERAAAGGEGCQVAHIIPRASGGHNGLGNIVLAHTKCNQDMGRRTPRDFWNTMKKGGFEEGVARVEQLFGDVERPGLSEVKTATGNSLWACYFNQRDDKAKIEQFKKDVTDIQQMTNRQDAATKYATRQIMAYLADALYDGHGLPERGGERKIFATDGMWTGRFRREWALFFDPHQFKAHGLSNDEEHARKEKNRGDHRHHAIDAVIIALATPQMRIAWDAREKQADVEGINSADEEVMDAYR
ncbi:MAG TPA: HNH endonuclease, partial [Tepidisphaeraceae bacterium]